MSSKKKLLRKIIAGIVEAPEGWEQLVEAATSDTIPQPATTVVVAQESATEIEEVTTTLETPAVEIVLPETIEVPTTTTSAAGQEVAAHTTRKTASKPRKTRTIPKRTPTKRKSPPKAKKE
jgi:hypothetical protein